MVHRTATFFEKRPKTRLNNYLMWSRALDRVMRVNKKRGCDFSPDELFSILEESLSEASEAVLGRVLTAEEEDDLRARVQSLRTLKGLT